MSDEQKKAVEELQEAIGTALFRLRDCTATGLTAGEAVRAAGIPWPGFSDPILEQMIAEVPAPTQ